MGVWIVRLTLKSNPTTEDIEAPRMESARETITS